MFSWIKKKSLALLSTLVSYGLTDKALVDVLSRGSLSQAGQNVTPDTALLVSSVYRAVNLYGDCMGIMPRGVYRRGGSKRKYYSDHPTHKVLHAQPNPRMGHATFCNLLEAHRLLRGAAYCEIEWNGRGQCIGLHPIEPWRVVPELETDTNRLRFRIDGQRTVYDADMLHVPNFSWCGTHGMSTLTFARESLGRVLAAGELASSTFEGGGIPPGFVKHPSKMDKVGRDNFRKEWRENAMKNKGNIGILWEGMDWQASGLSLEDVQFLGTLKNGDEDVSRFFGVPLHMLSRLERAINNNAEVGDLGWVKYSMLPLCLRWEEEFNRKLLPDDLYCKHSVEGLLRGDTAARSTWYREMHGIGVYTSNDILDFEDMDRVGPEGDVRVINAAYIPVSILEDYWRSKSKPGQGPGDPNGDGNPAPDPARPPAKQPPPNPPADPEEDQEPPPPKGLQQDPWFQAEWNRMLRRENKALTKAARHPGQFLAWMDEFYGRHADVMLEVLSAPARGFEHASTPVPLVELLVRDHIATTRQKLLSAAEVPRDQFEASIQQFIADRSLLSTSPHEPVAA